MWKHSVASQLSAAADLSPRRCAEATAGIHRGQLLLCPLPYYTICWQNQSRSSNLTNFLRHTLSSFTVFISISCRCCNELVHHFETIKGIHPYCLDSTGLDFFFTSTILRRLILCHLPCFYNRFMAQIYKILRKIITKVIKRFQKSTFLMNYVHHMNRELVRIQEIILIITKLQISSSNSCFFFYYFSVREV